VQGRGLNLLGGAPGDAGVDQLCFEQPDHRFGQGVVVGADRGVDAYGQPFGEGDRQVLRPVAG
jgi:hypothetical protein